MRETIQNRLGLDVVIEYDIPTNPTGLAFVAHGLGGFKEQPHIQTMVEAFREAGYVTVFWDATNSVGASGGRYEDATITNYSQDLEDVVTWAKSQEWYLEPFVLAGHSLGGISSALYAERYPDEVKALAPISTLVSGKLSHEVDAVNLDSYAAWQKTGWMERSSVSRPSVVMRLRWSHMEDRLKYDLLPEVAKLTMPILFIVGEKDVRTPPSTQQLLFDAIPHEDKEIHTIAGSDHTFRTPGELAELKRLFRNWLATLDK